VDCTGRAIRTGKRGHIHVQADPILRRLGIDSATWLAHMRPRQNRLLTAIGSVAGIADFVAKTGRQRFLDKHAAALLHA